MLAPILAMAFVLDSHNSPSPDPAKLVDQLGSPRYAARVSAEGELARLGRTALPALRAAKDSKDAEIRTRSVALISRIENDLLLKATPIGLDLRGVPVPDAVEAIARQASQGLSLAPEERSALANRRISVRSDGPLPFWEAIDAVCSAGDLHVVPGDPPSTNCLDGSLRLLDGPAVGSAPVSDSGAFRVRLSSVHNQAEIQLDQPRSTAGATREFYLQLVLAAEPRLSVTRDGPVKLSEAVDDRGQSLQGPAGLTGFRHEAAYFGMNPTSMLRFRVDLDYPETPAKQIKLLRGTIPVLVATRKPDPLVVPLAGSRGKLFRSVDVALTVLDLRPASANQPATVQVAVKPLGAGLAEPVAPGNGEPLGYRPDSFQQQIEVLDDQGRPLSWFPSSSIFDGEETRITMTIGPRGAAVNPATIRYHGILKATADVAFEFRDVPIP